MTSSLLLLLQYISKKSLFFQEYKSSISFQVEKQVPVNRMDKEFTVYWCDGILLRTQNKGSANTNNKMDRAQNIKKHEWPKIYPTYKLPCQSVTLQHQQNTDSWVGERLLIPQKIAQFILGLLCCSQDRAGPHSTNKCQAMREQISDFTASRVFHKTQ